MEEDKRWREVDVEWSAAWVSEDGGALYVELGVDVDGGVAAWAAANGPGARPGSLVEAAVAEDEDGRTYLALESRPAPAGRGACRRRPRTRAALAGRFAGLTYAEALAACEAVTYEEGAASLGCSRGTWASVVARVRELAGERPGDPFDASEC